MNSILFAHSYFLCLDPKQWQAANAYPPLGTLYAASLLRENGFRVSLFDSMLSTSPSSITAYLEQETPSYLVIYDDGFNYLTKMCLTNMREAAFEMIALAKQFSCTVIISSSDSTDHADLYLEQKADFVVLGEGEITLLDLIQCLEKNDDPAVLPGIAFGKEGRTVSTPKRPVLKDLDQLPLPAWDLADIAQYKSIWEKHHGYFSLNMATTRGCTYKCNWCAKPLFGNRYHARTPQQVVQELTLLTQTFGAEHIWFCDDIFGLKPLWIQEFSRLVQQQGLRFAFKIQSRADLMVDESTVKALAEAGCDMVWLGAESGSQKILDAMDKGITQEQIHTSRDLLARYGIKVGFFLQFGYPGETEEDIQATVNMVLKTMPDDIGISVTYPLPGTKLYENVKSQLNEKTNWTDSDELAMLFENRHSKAYYKALQRYVHRAYHRQKSVRDLKSLVKDPLSFTKDTFRNALRSIYLIPREMIAKRNLTATK